MRVPPPNTVWGRSFLEIAQSFPGFDFGTTLGYLQKYKKLVKFHSDELHIPTLFRDLKAISLSTLRFKCVRDSVSYLL